MQPAPLQPELEHDDERRKLGQLIRVAAHQPRRLGARVSIQCEVHRSEMRRRHEPDDRNARGGDHLELVAERSVLACETALAEQLRQLTQGSLLVALRTVWQTAEPYVNVGRR